MPPKGTRWGADLFVIGEVSRLTGLSTGRLRQLSAAQNIGKKYGINWLYTSEDIDILRKRPWRTRKMIVTKRQTDDVKRILTESLVKYFEARMGEEHRLYLEYLNSLAWRLVEIEKAVDRLTESWNADMGKYKHGTALPSLRRIVREHYRKERRPMKDVTPGKE